MQKYRLSEGGKEEKPTVYNQKLGSIRVGSIYSNLLPPLVCNLPKNNCFVLKPKQFHHKKSLILTAETDAFCSRVKTRGTGCSSLISLASG